MPASRLFRVTFLLLLISSLLLSVSGQETPEKEKKWLEMTGHVPERLEGDLPKHLTFIFNEKIAPIENAILTSSPIQVKVRQGANYLVLDLHPTPDVKHLIFRFHPDLKGAESGRSLDPKQRLWAVGRLQVLRLRNDRTASGVCFLDFSGPVGPGEVRSNLTLKDQSGDPLAVKDVESVSGKPHTLRVRFDPEGVYAITAHLNAGLEDATGRIETEKHWTEQIVLHPELNLERTEWAGFSGEQQAIRFYFSHEVDSSDLREKIEISDGDNPLDYEFVASARTDRHVARFSLPDLDKVNVNITVEKDLKGGSDSRTYGRKVVALKKPTINPHLGSRGWGTYEGQNAYHFYISGGQYSIQDLAGSIRVEPEVENFRVAKRYSYYYLLGDWVPGRQYRATIPKGTELGGWQKLNSAISFSFKAGDPARSLAFQEPEKFLFARGGRPHLVLESAALSKAELKVSRMFPENIAIAVPRLYGGRGGRHFVDLCAEPLYTSTTALNTHAYKTTTTQVYLDELLRRGEKGLFCVEAEGQNTYSSKLVMLTELGGIAHWENDRILCFVHDLRSLEPSRNARVTVYSNKQQQLFQGFTDAHGMIRFEDAPSALGEPLVAVIEKDTDYTFLELQPLDRGKDIIRKYSPYNSKAYDGYIYSDRELYRPGDTVHLRFIARTNNGLSPLVDTPLQVLVKSPNGKDIHSATLEFSEVGTAGLDLETQTSFPTGKYQVILRVPSNQPPVATFNFNIESFVPARMKASIELKEKVWRANERARIGVKAEQLHGGPAPDRKTECVIFFEKSDSLPGYENYHFSNASGKVPEAVDLGETMTNADGLTTLTWKFHKFPGVSTPLRATAAASVYELGGRAVSASQRALYLNDGMFLGLRLNGDESGSHVTADVIAIDAMTLKPVTTGSVQVSLDRMTWNYYMRRYYGYYGSNWSTYYETQESKTVELKDGKGQVSFEQVRYGGYRVRVQSEMTPMFAEKTFRRNWRGQGIAFDETRRDSVAQATLDKKEYAPGETARLTVTSPFDGRAVIVLQTQDIQSMHTVPLVDGRAQLDIPLVEKYAPNIWAMVTVIHKPTPDAFEGFPFAAFTAANIRVRPVDTLVDVAVVDLPEEIEPDTDLELTVQVLDGYSKPIEAECTIALVDEGIHLLTNYQKPDPAGRLLRSRSPGDFRHNHYYDRVLYDYSAPATGGGQPTSPAARLEEQMKKRLGAERESWIKSVALWTGAVRTGPDGRATATVHVPEFTGQLRVVVVAVSGKGFGAFEDRLFVRRPYMLRTSVPRYLLMGDKAVARATVFNTTDTGARARIEWEADGEYIKGKGSQKVDISAGGEASVTLDLDAREQPGSGKVQWTVQIDPEDGREEKTLSETTLLPVNSPAYLFQTRYSQIMLKPGESRVFENTELVDDERTEVEITVSNHPLMRLKRALEYVVGYPYGCIEQTTSRCFPLFAYRELSDVLGATLEERQDVEAMIQSGVDRLFSMQTLSGGLAYWPGRSTPYEHGSIYGAHFLTAVHQSREFRMDEENYQTLMDYVAGIARSSESPENSGLFRRAYATFVLAMAGHKEAPKLIESFDNIEEMPSSARYLLATATAYVTSDADKTRAYLENHGGADWPGFEMGDTLHSQLREKALHLMALRAAEAPADEVNRQVALLLESGLQEGSRYRLTTHETSFMLIALGQYLADQAEALKEKSGEKNILIKWNDGEKTINKVDVFKERRKGKNSKFTVENNTEFLTTVNWVVRGMPEKLNMEPVSEGVTIKRVFLDKDGAVIEDGKFEQGQSVVVRLEFKADSKLENLVIADLLPAGLEVENPRLAPESLKRMGMESAAPGYFDLRDDRMILFYDNVAKDHLYRYHYVATPVTPGEYIHPPVHAECMYAPAVRGSSAPGEIEVKP